MRRLLLSSAPLLSTTFVLLEPPSYQERIRGVYENKIRQNALPEKVFETFASIKEGKKFYMTPADLFKALTPFNYSAATNYNFFKEREILIIKAVDANRDGKVSFSEYFFFIVLLSTPAKELKRMFEVKGGKLNMGKFLEVMLEAKNKSPQGKRLANSIALDPRSTNITDRDFKESCSTLFEEFFSNKESIEWEEFKELRDKISEELLTYEFYSFEVENNCISAEDFAKSLIAYMPTSLSDMYLSRLESLKVEGCVSLENYLAFMFVMQEAQLVQKKLLIEHAERGTLHEHHISKVLKSICDNIEFCKNRNIKISDLQISIFMKLLDLDDSKSLEPNEIINLVSSRGSQGTSQSANPNFGEVVNDFKRFLNSLLKFSGINPFFKVNED
ncbi:hypothetical protein SteCoe_16081 [Stentor coeruleus]|uniref:EF-hand domain-containing protein n=1 Tax=Stentor coeruleus TaxID=5963 RepID=A0A1R2C249_9CILI|nr:hypothetical protein SteCoe_16081 [Stentor coeruleus]